MLIQSTNYKSLYLVIVGVECLYKHILIWKKIYKKNVH